MSDTPQLMYYKYKVNTAFGLQVYTKIGVKTKSVSLLIFQFLYA